ncbi:MAG: hypothetical protein R2755_00125 [Acidimicrobiales bacterium]
MLRCASLGGVAGIDVLSAWESSAGWGSSPDRRAIPWGAPLTTFLCANHSGEAPPDADLLQAVARRHGGVVLEAGGAALACGFPDAAAAVRAALALQPPAAGGTAAGGAPRLRIGVHTEVPEAVRVGMHLELAGSRAADAPALVLHRTRRIADAAESGQVVVSGDVATRLGATPGVTLRPVGWFRLRDFPAPVELLLATDTPTGDGEQALRVPSVLGQQGAAPRASMIGRDGELAELAARVAARRLVSVVGAGGIGKTRLVAEYGRRHTEDWFDGLCWVDLADVDDPAAVAPAVAGALAVGHQGCADALAAVIARLADRELVLVLDTAEHVAAALAALADRLLRACPSLRIVVTSRRPLGLIDESVLRLGPLAEEHAVALFVDRAAGRRDQLEDDADLPVLCRHFDGLPLAAELAAARTDVLGVAALLDHVRRGWYPTATDPTVALRQRSLPGLVGWSYRQLDGDEQAALRRLTVFAGDFDLEAAGAAVGGGAVGGGAGAPPNTDTGPGRVAELVWSLASASLLEVVTEREVTRYRLLGPVRAVIRMLTPADELRAAALGAAAWLRATLGAAAPVDPASIGHRAHELPNLEHLLALLTATATGAERATGAEPADVDALARIVAAQRRLGAPAAALAWLDAHLDRHPGDGPGRFALLVEAGRCAVAAGELDRAERFVEAARALARRGALPDCSEMELETLTGELFVRRGAPNLARRAAAEALPTARTAAGRARLLMLAAVAAAEAGDLDAGRSQAAQAAALHTEAGDPVAAAAAQALLAELALAQGDGAGAAALQEAALRVLVPCGEVAQLAGGALLAAGLAAGTGRWATAGALVGAATTVLRGSGVRLWPSTERRRVALDREVHAALGPAEALEASLAGAALGIEELSVLVTSALDQHRQRVGSGPVAALGRSGDRRAA